MTKPNIWREKNEVTIEFDTERDAKIAQRLVTYLTSHESED